MAFVDELKIYAKAGNGGDGVVRWRREKYEPMGGPAGGNGGNGGDVYLRGVKDLGILSKYSHNPKFLAENGQEGQGRSLFGKNGEDLYIDVPIGSVITKKETGERYEINEAGQEIQILSGGRGGFGNEHFKASTNTTPMEWTPGKPGEDANCLIEVELFADAGFVGLPSAGKSSLLNELTNAKSKVAEYHFTTLEPHLGKFHEFILADIPGLIEGASAGKGLGHKFLRHIKRTELLVHLIPFEYGDDMMEKYLGIRKELEDFDEELGGKEEIILLTKTDMVRPEEVTAKRAEFEKLGKKVFAVTLYDDDSVKNFSDEFVKILRNKSTR
jgi:GTP-binding protein